MQLSAAAPAARELFLRLDADSSGALQGEEVLELARWVVTHTFTPPKPPRASAWLSLEPLARKVLQAQKALEHAAGGAPRAVLQATLEEAQAAQARRLAQLEAGATAEAAANTVPCPRPSSAQLVASLRRAHSRGCPGEDQFGHLVAAALGHVIVGWVQAATREALRWWRLQQRMDIWPNRWVEAEAAYLAHTLMQRNGGKNGKLTCDAFLSHYARVVAHQGAAQKAREQEATQRARSQRALPAWMRIGAVVLGRVVAAVTEGAVPRQQLERHQARASDAERTHRSATFKAMREVALCAACSVASVGHSAAIQVVAAGVSAALYGARAGCSTDEVNIVRDVQGENA